MARPSINRFFKEVLGVTPRNTNWSWGAVEESNRRVFFRVWSDQLVKDAGIERITIGWEEYDPGYRSAGISERKQHIELIKSGYTGYGVLCNPSFDNEGKRHIGSFEEETLLRFGRIAHEDGQIYAQIAEVAPTYSVLEENDNDASLLRDIRSEYPELPVRTTSEAVILARVGQGRFRRQLLDKWGSCCVTVCNVQAALRASHIKPWSHCEESTERLDINNGLLLIANLDALFDAGLISFSDKGQIMIAESIPSREWRTLGLSANLKLKERPNRAMKRYLAYHHELHHFT